MIFRILMTLSFSAMIGAPPCIAEDGRMGQTSTGSSMLTLTIPPRLTVDTSKLKLDKNGNATGAMVNHNFDGNCTVEKREMITKKDAKKYIMLIIMPLVH